MADREGQSRSMLARVMYATRELLSEGDLRRRAVPFMLNEGSKALAGLQKGITRNAALAAAEMTRQLRAAQVPAFVNGLLDRVQEYKHQRAMAETKMKKVDVQVGRRVLLEMPQEMRSRFWWALLEHPEMRMGRICSPKTLCGPTSIGATASGAAVSEDPLLQLLDTPDQALHLGTVLLAQADLTADLTDLTADLAATSLESMADRAAASLESIPAFFLPHVHSFEPEQHSSDGAPSGATEGNQGAGDNLSQSLLVPGISDDAADDEVMRLLEAAKQSKNQTAAASLPKKGLPELASPPMKASTTLLPMLEASGDWELLDSGPDEPTATPEATPCQLLLQSFLSAADAVAEMATSPPTEAAAAAQVSEAAAWAQVDAPVTAAEEVGVLDSGASASQWTDEQAAAHSSMLGPAVPRDLWAYMLEAPWVRGTGLVVEVPPDCRFLILQEMTAGQSTVDDEIMRDLARTFPEHPLFTTDAGQLALFKLLKAYSLHDLEVGYCQGMAFAAGILLMYLPVEPAFRLYCRLMAADGPNLRRLYLPGLNELKAELAHFDALLAHTQPALQAHLEAYGIPPVLYVSQWVMTVYAAPFPPSFAARLVDVMLQDKDDSILLRCALAIMDELAPALLQLHDFEALLTALKIMPVQWDDGMLRTVLITALSPPGPSGPLHPPTVLPGESFTSQLQPSDPQDLIDFMAKHDVSRGDMTGGVEQGTGHTDVSTMGSTDSHGGHVSASAEQALGVNAPLGMSAYGPGSPSLDDVIAQMVMDLGLQTPHQRV